MASFNSVVAVFGVLCVISSQNFLGTLAQESLPAGPDPALPANPNPVDATSQSASPETTTTPSNAQDPPKQVGTEAKGPEVKPEPAAVPEPAAEPEPGTKPKGTPQQGSQADPKSEPAPKEDPKTNAQAAEKGKEGGKAGSASLYANCGLLVLAGAMLLRV